MLFRLGVRDINRLCLLWKEEDIAKVGGQLALGSLTPLFHFVSLKPRRVATDIDDEKSPTASLAFKS